MKYKLIRNRLSWLHSAILAWLAQLRLAAFLVAAGFLAGCQHNAMQEADIPPNPVVPDPVQAAYQEMELIGFIHFTMNTFTDKEWGFGDEDPALFNPSELDAGQWAANAKAAGMKELILTAKHHDGFCLWPSAYTEHSIRNSPYRDGEGDIVREFVNACREHGLKAGLYLSPWDRNHPDYGTPAYITYYRNQLVELLTEYGEISEIWFDGANGGDGYYGGANETRRIDRRTYYGWDSTIALVKRLQPGISVFSDAGPDIHWIGNEKGHAGETFWSMINRDSVVIGASDPAYLNTGDPEGTDWVVGQCDVSVRPGWFYHPSDDNAVKSPQQLVDIYYKSVGRNAVLLLNLPPDRRGLIHENDVDSLRAFRRILDETFSVNLARGAKASASNTRKGSHRFMPGNVLDDDPDTYWATGDSILPAVLEIQFKKPVLFDRIMIQEPIRLGQRIKSFQVDVMQDGEWRTVCEGTTVGYKRLLRIDPVTADKFRLNILDANNTVAVSTVGMFLSSVNE
jgi:alpha-L-fucosidase